MAESKFSHSVRWSPPNSTYDYSLTAVGGDTLEEFQANLAAVVGGDLSALVAAADSVLRGGGAAATLTQPQTVQQTAAPAPAAVPAGFSNVAQPTAPAPAPAQPVAQPVAQPAAPPAAPAAPAAGPGGTPPVCPHGAMRWKTSKPGAARTWQAFMCPAPKGTPDQCDPIWQ